MTAQIVNKLMTGPGGVEMMKLADGTMVPKTGSLPVTPKPTAAPALPGATPAPTAAPAASNLSYSSTEYKAPAPITFTAPTPQVATATQGTAQTYEVDPSKTTYGLLMNMLKDDSPYLEHARNKALDGMSGRGLLSSSMAQGAGVAAAYDAATPIASQDSGIYANRMTANQQAVNEMANANANRSTDVSMANAAQANAMNMSVLELQTKNEQFAQSLGLDYNKLNQADQQFIANHNLDIANYELNKTNTLSDNALDAERFAFDKLDRTANTTLNQDKFAQDKAQDAIKNALDDRTVSVNEGNLDISKQNLANTVKKTDAEIQLSFDKFASEESIKNNGEIGALYRTYMDKLASIQQDTNLDADGKLAAVGTLKAAFVDGVRYLGVTRDFSPDTPASTPAPTLAPGTTTGTNPATTGTGLLDMPPLSPGDTGGSA